MNQSFWKYVAAGNDFILINDLAELLQLSAGEIKSLCDRKFGIGADGILLLRPSEATDFRMLYYNADGSRGEMCGNGARSLVLFAAHQGVIGGSGQFEADDGVHDFRKEGNRISVEIKVPDRLKAWELPHESCGFINTGVPHLVVPVENLDGTNLVALGEDMNRHPAHPQGTNTNIIERKTDKIWVRTWERGVNTETLACGTGAAAVAIYAHQVWNESWPVKLSFRGGDLEVDFYNNQYWLSGPTKLVFAGQLTSPPKQEK